MNTEILSWYDLGPNPLAIKSKVAVDPFNGRKKTITLEKTSVTIGKGKECDIVIDDPFLSEKHARFEFVEKDSAYVLHDLNSKNGTYLNGIKISKAPLRNNFVLKIGQSKITKSEEFDCNSDESFFLTKDEKTINILYNLKHYADTNLPILLLGETGTGKDVLANYILEHSSRKKEVYLVVNCAAISQSLIESELFGHKKGSFTGANCERNGAFLQANNGTLFLDEIGELSLENQAKLLRAIENGEIKQVGADAFKKTNVRLIFATNRDLKKMVNEGTFREDLYYRISTLEVKIPPLRERKSDIKFLAKKFAENYETGISNEAIDCLLKYSWPGNVRELKQTITKAFYAVKASGEPLFINPSHLSFLGSDFLTLVENNFVNKTYSEFEKEIIIKSLEKNHYNKTATAKILGISKSTMFKKIKDYNIIL